MTSPASALKSGSEIDNQETELLTTAQAAKFLSISVVTLKRMRQIGPSDNFIPPQFIRLGPTQSGCIRYIRSELVAWVLKHPRYNSTSNEPVSRKVA